MLVFLLAEKYRRFNQLKWGGGFDKITKNKESQINHVEEADWDNGGLFIFRMLKYFSRAVDKLISYLLLVCLN